MPTNVPMRTARRMLPHLIAVAATLVPLAALAWAPGNPIIPCGFTADNQCTFPHFVQLVVNVIDALLYFATILAAISFAYAGFLYVTNAGNPGKISDATGIFKKVGIGYAVALGAWLIVRTIEIALRGAGAPTFLQG